MTNYTSAYFDKSLDNIYYIFYPKEKNAGGKDKPLIFALLTIYIVSYTRLQIKQLFKIFKKLILF